MSQAPLARTEDLVVQSVGDELIIVDSRTDQAHALPAPVAQVWELCDGTRSVDAIMEALNVEPAFVMQALEELEACKLLRVVEPVGLVNRRVMIGRTAGLAVTGALIATIAVPPTLAMASSGRGSAMASTANAGNSALTVLNKNGTGSAQTLSVGHNLFVNSDGTNSTTSPTPPSDGDNWQIIYGSAAISISFTAGSQAPGLTGSFTYTDTLAPANSGDTNYSGSKESVVSSGGSACPTTPATASL